MHHKWMKTLKALVFGASGWIGGESVGGGARQHESRGGGGSGGSGGLQRLTGEGETSRQQFAQTLSELSANLRLSDIKHTYWLSGEITSGGV